MHSFTADVCRAMATDYYGVVGGDEAEVRQLLPWQYPSTIAVPAAEFPRLHSALTLSRHEVDALGGLRLLRAGRVPAFAPHRGSPAAAHFIATNVIPDAALE